MGKIAVRVVLYALTAFAAYLLVDAIVADDAPAGQWIFSIIVLVVMVPMIIAAWRLRLMTPEDRAARVERLESRRDRFAAASTAGLSKQAKRGTKQRILSEGVPATARIIGIRDGQQASTFSTLVGIELEVRLPGRDPYVTETGESVSRAAIGIVAPGRELSVRVLPDDDSSVAVDWDASMRLSDTGQA